jgi:hypothetical protein
MKNNSNLLLDCCPLWDIHMSEETFLVMPSNDAKERLETAKKECNKFKTEAAKLKEEERSKN